MSNKEAALIEPLSVSIHVADRANVTEKTIAVILGAGIIGAGVAARLVDRGGGARAHCFCRPLAVPARSSCKAGLCGRQQREPGWQQKLIGLTGMAYCVYGPGSAADYIFDCAGSIDPIAIEPTLLEQAIRLLKFGGTMVLAGVHRRKVPLNLQKRWSLVFRTWSAAAAPTAEVPIAIDMLNRKVIDFEALVTHSFAHKDAIEAIKFACDTNQCLKGADRLQPVTAEGELVDETCNCHYRRCGWYGLCRCQYLRSSGSHTAAVRRKRKRRCKARRSPLKRQNMDVHYLVTDVS